MKFDLIKKRNPQLSLLQQVLTNRGIQDVDHYLHTSDLDILNPCLFPNMDKGINLFLNERANRSKTIIIVDCDVDGLTSAAILYNYAYRLWPDWTWKYFLHAGKQHGLADCVNYIIEQGFEFVIAPDSSSNDLSELRQLAEHGIRTLILDHHDCDTESQDAVVINNQMCSYPNKSLSGAGVVYKFCQRLDQLLNYSLADDFLDLAAVGMIADMEPLLDLETHRLIEKGLNNVQNQFLVAMMEKNEYSLKGHINPQGVSFYVAPTMNAVMRLGTMEEKTILFQALLEKYQSTTVASGKRGAVGQQVSLVSEAVRQATNVKARQAKVRDSKYKELKTIIDEEQLINNKILVLCQENKDADEVKGMNGLIANQLMAAYKHPVLLLQRIEHEDGSVSYDGSGRNVPHTELTDFRAFVEETGLVNYAQGHSAAFGVSIPAENINKFIDLTNERLANIDFSTAYLVDDIIDGVNVRKEDISSLYSARDLWGQDVNEPYIAFRSIKASPDTVIASEKIIKIVDMTAGVYYVKFKPTPEEFMFFSSLSKTYTLDIVGTCSYNDYDYAPMVIITDYNINKETYWDF